MFDTAAPIFAPLLLPSDAEALAACGRLAAAFVPATVAVNDRLLPLARGARERAQTLFVDPRTATFQFEGYVSMEDIRALPYSPGRGTLGALWGPSQFTRPFRQEVIRDVAALQVDVGADVIMAPYFHIPSPQHAWLEVAVDIARETRERAGRRPVAVSVCVDIDAMLAEAERVTYADAFVETGADVFLVTVVNFDEREATPAEVRAVFDLLARLGRAAPVLLLYVGRVGLAAVANGAAGYGGGSLELEAHPRRYLREGLVNLHSDAHYLPGAMLRLPVRLAAAVAEHIPETDAAGSPLATRMVRRLRTQRALDAKAGEVQWLGTYGAAARREALHGRLESALELCRRAQAELLQDGAGELARSDFHYLEVLRELVGGEQAEMIGGAGF
jgi:hypothetical protein